MHACVCAIFGSRFVKHFSPAHPPRPAPATARPTARGGQVPVRHKQSFCVNYRLRRESAMCVCIYTHMHIGIYI